MASAMFGLFAGGNASKVFSELGIIAQKTSKSTSNLALQVEKASARMTAAANKEKSAMAKVQIEQAKLNEMRTKGNVVSSKLMAQEERLADSQRKSTVATRENASATSNLASSQKLANAQAENMGRSTSVLGTRLKGATKVMGRMIAVAAVYKAQQFLRGSIDEAVQAENAQKKLEVSIGNTGNSWTDYQDSVKKTIVDMEAFGFADEDTMAALSNMTKGMKDPAKALEHMGLVANIAAQENMSLNDASIIVTKTVQGYSKAAKKLLVDSGAAAGGTLAESKATEAHAKAVKELQAAQGKTGGGGGRDNKAAIAAQARLNSLQAKYGNVSKRTAAQSAQIAKAQNAVTKANNNTTASTNKAGMSAKEYARLQQKVADTAKTLKEVTDSGTISINALNETYSGAAVSNMDTYSAKQKILGEQFKNIQQQLGAKLIGPLGDFSTWLVEKGIPNVKKLNGWFEKWGINLPIAATALAGVFVSLRGIILLANTKNALRILGIGVAGGVAGGVTSAGTLGGLGLGVGLGVGGAAIGKKIISQAGARSAAKAAGSAAWKAAGGISGGAAAMDAATAAESASLADSKNIAAKAFQKGPSKGLLGKAGMFLGKAGIAGAAVGNVISAGSIAIKGLTNLHIFNKDQIKDPNQGLISRMFTGADYIPKPTTTSKPAGAVIVPPTGKPVTSSAATAGGSNNLTINIAGSVVTLEQLAKDLNPYLKQLAARAGKK